MMGRMAEPSPPPHRWWQGLLLLLGGGALGIWSVVALVSVPWFATTGCEDAGFRCRSGSPTKALLEIGMVLLGWALSTIPARVLFAGHGTPRARVASVFAAVAIGAVFMLWLDFRRSVLAL